jgi:chemotaxis protein CheC
MKLEAMQKDALIEICNLGMSKAAKQLSILLGSEIKITIPSIHLLNLEKFESEGFIKDKEALSFVYQDLLDSLEGRAVLVFKTRQTKNLTDSIISQSSDLSEKEERIHEQEAMIEIGNIIISSCISAIVNMLKIQVNLTIPKYNENEIDVLINKQLDAVETAPEETFIIRTDLKTVKESISGHLLLVLTNNSVTSMLDKISHLFGGQSE